MAGPNSAKLAVLIMAGGSGTRFWPLSRKERPKQYVPLFGEKSLLQLTLERTSKLAGLDHTFIISAKNQESLLKKHLNPSPEIILEPQARNTAPCLMLATIQLRKRGFAPETPVVVLPADHFVGDAERLSSILQSAAKFAVASKGLVTLGIVPSSPHTGYGYIEAGSQIRFEGEPTFQVKRFIEKPDRARAEVFVQQESFYWNSGMFVWTLEAITKAFEQYLPKEWKLVESAASESELETNYASLPSVPVDIGVLEKAKNVFVIPASIDWSDVGSWDSLFQMTPKIDGSNAVIGGETKLIQSRNCYVKTSSQKKVALVGVENLIIVEEGDRLLIVQRSKDQLVKEITKDGDF